MLSFSPSTYLRYGVALVLVLAALLIRWLLHPFLDDLFPFTTIFFAVLLAAWYGGFGPALLATVLGTGGAAWLFLSPRGSFNVQGFENQAGLAFNAAISLGIAVMGGAMRSAQLRWKAAAERHQAMEEHLSALVDASATLTLTLESPAVSNSIFRLSEQLVPSDAYAIWRFHAASNQWQIASASGLSESYQQATVRLLTQAPGMPDRPVVADDVFALPFLASRKEMYQTEGIRSLLILPLRIHGQICGTLAVYHRQPHHFDESEVRLATALANLSAAIIGSADSFEEQVRLRAEALEHQERLRVTLASIGDAVIATDTEGRATFLNEVAEALTGWTLAEANGREVGEFFRIVNERTRQMVENPVHRVLREGKIVGLANHTVLIARDGKETPIDDSGAPIRGENGGVSGVVLVFRDVTERKAAERAVREKAQVLTGILAATVDHIYVMDREGRYLYVSTGGARVLGYEPHELTGKRVRELGLPADVIAPIDAQRERVLQTGTPDFGETDYVTPMGDTRHYEYVVAPLLDENNRGEAVVFVSRDVTGRRKQEVQLRQSEERLRLALEAGRMGVWDWNVQAGTLKWTDNLEPIYGLTPGTFKGTIDAFQELIHPDDRKMVQQALARALQLRESYDIEFRSVWPDGSVHWMAGKGKVFADDGQPIRMVGVGLDITERKRIDEDNRFLAEASAALADLVDEESTMQKVARLAVPHFADWAAVDVLEENNTLRRVAVAHVDPAKVQLAHELQRRFPADPKAPTGVWNILRTGKPEMIREITEEMLIAMGTDKERLGIVRQLGLRSYMGVPLRVRGKVLGVITFIAAESGRLYDDKDLILAEDLAHRAAVAIENSQLYQALREADRRKDEFLAMLAHELRNPLAPIRNALQVFRLSSTDRGTLEQVSEMMERQVEHLVRLVDDLLDVSRVMRGKIELKRERVALATVVRRAVETAQPLLDAHGHHLTVSLPPELHELHADPVRLAQVLTNLLTNAAKFTHEPACIALTIEGGDGEVVMRVRDPGIGIPADQLDRIFDLFVQLDHGIGRVRGGLGIGLTLVKSLVEMHGGRVQVHSEGPGRGSEFIVRLPVLAPEQPGAPAQTEGEIEQPTPAAAKRRILIVDDNRDAADSLALLLRLQGQEVRVAYDGTAGLEAARAFVPDLVFLDIGMPGMDGYEVAKLVRQVPGLASVRLAAMTGWGQEDDRRRSREAGFDLHFVKPVEPNVLLELLTEPRT